MNLEKQGRRKFATRAGLALLGLATFGPAVLVPGGSTAKAEELATLPAFLDVEVLMYHEIGSKRLISDLMAKINSGSQPISTETFVGGFNGEIILPQGQRLFYLTLDDGRSSQYPAVLEATQKIQNDTGIFIPATFFALTKFGDPLVPMEGVPGDTPCYNDGKQKYMTKDNLINLIEQGHWVDNHTVNHANLLLQSVGSRNSEVVIGKQRIQSLWDLAGKNKPYNIFAYPFGAQNTEQTAFLKSVGYDLAFSERPTSHHLSSERLLLGRINMPA